MTDPFHPLSVRDIPMLTRYFARQDTRLCNASAGAAVLWQPYFQDAALELDGTLLLREQFPGLGTVFSTPIGERVGNAYDFLVKYCREVGKPLQFFPATASDVENLRARFGAVEVTTMRDWFDYLYDAQDMVTFRGRRFNGQRNHIHHFQRLYPDRYGRKGSRPCGCVFCQGPVLNTTLTKRRMYPCSTQRKPSTKCCAAEASVDVIS